MPLTYMPMPSVGTALLPSLLSDHFDLETTPSLVSAPFTQRRELSIPLPQVPHLVFWVSD